MKGKEVKSVCSAKYLEVILNEDLAFKEHIKKVVNKANQFRGFFLQRNIGSCPARLKRCFL